MSTFNLSSDIAHDIFYGVLTPFSMASNALLIYIVLRTQKDSLGPYRYLIITFAISDMVASLTHHATQQHLQIIDEWLRDLSEYAFVATVVETLVLLAYHYLYRLSILYSHFFIFALTWSRAKYVIGAVSLNILYTAMIMLATTWVLAPSDRSFVTERMVATSNGIDIRDPRIGYLAVILQRTNSNGIVSPDYRSLIGMAGVMVPVFATCCAIVYCIVKIRAKLQETSNLSKKTTAMQQHLFKCLLIQSAVPCIFSYIPIGILVVATDLEISLDGDFIVLCTAIFPAIDGLFVIAFINPYRKTLFLWFRFARKLIPMNVTTIATSSFRATQT